MTDRELLDAAAKAAGIKLLPQVEGREPRTAPPELEEWNPLEDDGDALRLAVKLGIELRQRAGVMASALYSADNPNGFAVRDEMYNMHNGDPYAASRRAIVRAAAAMGQA